MAVIAQSYKDRLKEIKENIKHSYTWFKPNYERFHEFRRFVFETSITDDQQTLLKQQQKPIVEFNILDAYVSRQAGEFSKHEPSINVKRGNNQNVHANLIEVVEDHIRHIIYTANKNGFANEVYLNLLSGGFDVIKWWTEYENQMSFDQVIRLGRCFDPTLCGFDPLARTPNKGDGKFSFELFPFRADDFESKYGINCEDMLFTRDIGGFNWSYENQQGDPILLLAEYFEKKHKKIKIVKLSNGRSIPEKQYEKLQEVWEKQGIMDQIPHAINSRKTEVEIICRYKLIEKEIFDYKETDFTYLPHIFVCGKAINLSDHNNSKNYQFVMPYVYHAKGLQNLKNYAGQTLANCLENMVQHKFIVMKEAIPQEDDYVDALTNIQNAGTIVVNAYSENNPDKPIPMPIREVQPVPAPPEVMNTFTITDQLSQVVLGSYDAALGINDNQLSGVAIQEAATQSNAVGMPYVNGYLLALKQFGISCLDLIPKYLITPRSLPGINNNGDSYFTNINYNRQNMLQYDSGSLDLEIEAGVNFEIQKNQSMNQIVALMQASPEFQNFMNQKGLMILIKNMTIHGGDQLEELAEEYLQQKQKMQAQSAQMQQQAMQNDPRMITAKAKMLEVQNKQQQNQAENNLDIARVSIEKQHADNEGILAQAQVKQQDVSNALQIEKSQTEREVHALDAAAKIASVNRDHVMAAHDTIRKTVELTHKIHHDVKSHALEKEMMDNQKEQAMQNQNQGEDDDEQQI